MSKQDVSFAAHNDLSVRLLEYTTNIARLVDSMTDTRSAHQLGKHLVDASVSVMSCCAKVERVKTFRTLAEQLTECIGELKTSHQLLLLIQEVPLIQDTTLLVSTIWDTEEIVSLLRRHLKAAKKGIVYKIDMDVAHPHRPGDTQADTTILDSKSI